MAVSASAARADVITLVADPWCPYTCDPKSDRPGYMVEIAREVFARTGHAVRYELVSWSSALRMVRDGQADAVVGASPNDDASLVFPAVPQGRSGKALATRSGFTFAFRGTESLHPFRLGVIRDYGYGEPFDSYVRVNGDDARRIVIAGGFGYAMLNQLLRALVETQVDLVVDDQLVLYHALGQLGLGERVGITPLLGVEEPVFIAFSPRRETSRAYAAELAEGMKTLRVSGRLKEIMGRYGLPDWQVPLD